VHKYLELLVCKGSDLYFIAIPLNSPY